MKPGQNDRILKCLKYTSILIEFEYKQNTMNFALYTPKSTYITQSSLKIQSRA